MPAVTAASRRPLIARIPGALMIVPLLLGALLNSVDQLHLPAVQSALKALGAPPVVDLSSAPPLKDPVTGEILRDPVTGAALKDPRHGVTRYELLNLGGFTTALTRGGALTLIAMFLVCVGSQMDFRVGRRAVKKGLVITAAKLAAAVAVGYLLALVSDPFHGFLGLSLLAVIAAMSNGNGGLYLALTGEYGNRSDVGAVSVISLNDGPFLTMLGLGILGEGFPMAAFVAVLLPIVVGFIAGQISPSARAFLRPGERLAIPFFAFALGTTMNLGAFGNVSVLAGGLALGISTVIITGAAAMLALRLAGERSTIAGIAEASTAGNAVQTPLAVATAAAAGAATGLMPPERAAAYADIVAIATAQISIATLSTALLCPLAVVLWHQRQLRRGIDGRHEHADEAAPARPAAVAAPAPAPEGAAR